MPKYKKWTKREDDFLRQNYPFMTQRELGYELGRSKGSVYNRLKKNRYKTFTGRKRKKIYR